MMKRLLLLALLLGAPATAQTPVKVTAENGDRIRQVGDESCSRTERSATRTSPRWKRCISLGRAGIDTPAPVRCGAALKLDAAPYMTANNTAGLIVAQAGKVKLERYERGYSAKGHYTSFSVAKSLTSTLVGAAVRDGFIKSVDDPVTRRAPTKPQIHISAS